MNRVSEYFNLYSKLEKSRDTFSGEEKKSSSLANQYLQYLALSAGIFLEPLFTTYQETKTWIVPDLGGAFLFALIAGLLIFPGVYKSSFDPKTPILAQLGTIIAIGMGWESLLANALGG